MNPFIIWTVQRTGGTNFATNLIKLSGLPITTHEPLNIGRTYGYITHKWRETRNRDELDKSIADFLDKGYAIKHCVENVDWEINESLIKKSIDKKFWHIILYREKSVDRLLSLHFAMETGLWGRKKVSAAKETMGKQFGNIARIKHLDVDALVEHEQYCNDCLVNVARCITKDNSRIYAISFEDIYEANLEAATKKASIILKEIGITEKSIIDDFISHIRNAGDQGSKKIYNEIRGRHDLEHGFSKFISLKERIYSEFPDLIPD